LSPKYIKKISRGVFPRTNVNVGIRRSSANRNQRIYCWRSILCSSLFL